jgi:hypothetical protein
MSFSRSLLSPSFPLKEPQWVLLPALHFRVQTEGKVTKETKSGPGGEFSDWLKKEAKLGF